jgi:putative Mn2+ efflux pump MntP
MNSIQIAILALALALNSFMTYLTAGYVLRDESGIRKMRFGLIVLMSQILMSGTGLWLGVKIGILAANSNYYISLGILLIMGLKIVFDSIRTRPEDKAFDFSDTRVIVMLSIAEGITPLVIGIAIGLVAEYVLLPWIILAILQFLSILIGLIAGSRYGVASFRFRLGPVGGLIMLAAALKLLIDLIGY